MVDYMILFSRPAVKKCFSKVVTTCCWRFGNKTGFNNVCLLRNAQGQEKKLMLVKLIDNLQPFEYKI